MSRESSVSGHEETDANLAGAANDFEALELLRKLAFAGTAVACAQDSGAASSGVAGRNG